MTPFMGAPGLETFLYGIFWIVVAVALLIYLGVRIGMMFILKSYIKPIPSRSRNVNSVVLWLAVIPVFAILLNFIIFPAIAYSYRDVFEDENLGDEDLLDNFIRLAWFYPVVYAFSLAIVPLNVMYHFFADSRIPLLLGIVDLIVLPFLLSYLIDLNRVLQESTKNQHAK